MDTASDQIKTTLHWLKRRGFDARYAKDREAAKQIVLDMVPPDWIVGVGDSSTIRSMGVLQELEDRGHRVFNPFVKPKIMRERPAPTPFRVTKQTSQACDVFLSSTNAVTMDGKIVSIDGGGMRVTGIAFGSPISIVIAGRNKIAKNAEDALYRIKNIVAPNHAKTIGPDWGFPCVAAGKCVEPETFCEAGNSRMCNVVLILEAQPNMRDNKIAVILVDEDLGLGWDPDWPEERKDKIFAEYRQFTPPHRPVKT